MDTAPLVLSVRGLCKRYAAPVLVDVDFDVRRGEVHALVGANGAGKSTLARIVCGLVQAERGRMELRGRPHAPWGKAAAERAGVAMVMQELNLLPTLSVAENLLLNRLPRRWGLIDFRRLRRDACTALAAVGLDTLDPAVRVDRLGVGHQQLVEIAAALAQDCALLILDEPTAALTDPQIDLLFHHVRRLTAAGVGIVYISHRMDEIRRIADRVTVLRDGRVVAVRPAAETTPGELVALMIGRRAAAAAAQGGTVGGAVALRVEGLCRGKEVRDVSFEVRRGEILGLAGLVGSGRTETLRALFGADRPQAGRVLVGNPLRPVRIRAPRHAVRAGMALIPEDRKQQGLLLAQSLRSNITLGRLGTLAHGAQWIDTPRERAAAAEMMRMLGIRAASMEQPVAELSGGNQQRAVMARWLYRDADIYLFDEPTRGIDVAAKESVYHLLRRLAAGGKAIVVASSELEELLNLCDRIAVLSAGRLAATFERNAFSQEAIMAAAFSGYLGRSGARGRKDVSQGASPAASQP